MATEELIVLLDAKTTKLDAKLKATERRLDELDGSTTKADKSFANLSRTASNVAGSIAKVATVALAISAAVSAMVLASAKGRKELELLSKQAKVSAEDFQALAFATEQYGINAEQIADISKDIADRVGEFSAAGTGTFQDYADVMKLTKDEARKTAIEFQSLSSQEVIGKMVSEMEKAGVTGDKMTFVLESLGNDLSRLQPLFSNNSAELKKLKDRFKDVNTELAITDLQAEKLKAVSTSYQLMTAQIGNATTAISASLAPVMDDFFNDVINVVPQATQTIIDFVNSFLDAENITSTSGVLKEISAAQRNLLELEVRLADAKEQTRLGGSGLVNTAEIQVLAAEAAIAKEKERTAELNTQLTILEGQKQSLEDARSLRGGQIGGETGEGGSGSGIGTGDQIQAIADRFKDEELLLEEKLQRELEIIGENQELRVELEKEFQENLVEIFINAEREKMDASEKASKDKISLDKKRQKTEQSLEKQNISSIMSIVSALVGHNSNIGKLLFVGAQALAASQVFFNTQAAAARALAELGPIAGPPVAAAIETSGALSIAAIAATTLGGVASGGSSSGSISSASSAPQTQEQDFQQETATQQISVTNIGDETSTGLGTVEFIADGGSASDEIFADMINQMAKSGRLKTRSNS